MLRRVSPALPGAGRLTLPGGWAYTQSGGIRAICRTGVFREDLMILIGGCQSPFVRRVAISLRLLDIPFDHKPLRASTEPEKVRAYNPLGRIPALELDDGFVLIDSAAILDYLDEVAGPQKALVPPSGPARREVLRAVMLAAGAMEKMIAAFVESRIRPEETRHRPLLDRFIGQALAGFDALEAAAGDGWLCCGRLTQADVTVVAALGFLRQIEPQAAPDGRFPRLEALARRAEALPAFAQSRP